MESIWWTHLTRANSFLNQIVQILSEEGSLVVTLPEKLPWRGDFMEMIRDELALENDSRKLDVYECPEEEPGSFLLKRYCTEEKRSAYRYGISYAEFLGRSSEIVLNRRYIWITGISGRSYGEWLDFVDAYLQTAGNKRAAVFILETADADLAAQKGKKRVRKLAYDQNIGSYDRFAFCALAAAQTSAPDYLRPYLAELASTLCGQDVELAAQCVGRWKQFLENPAQTIQRIAKECPRSDGTQFRYSLTDREIRRLIWETQIRTVFPQIERFRSSFIEKYYDHILAQLPIANSQNEVISRPEEVEIGLLYYIAINGMQDSCSVDDELLNCYRKARNDLAHLYTVDYGTVELILRQGERI